MTESRHKAYPLLYQDLYIYLIKGILRESDEASLGNDFLGNWVEADSSFLFFSRPSSAAATRLLKTRPDLKLDDDYHFLYDEWQGGEATAKRFRSTFSYHISLSERYLIYVISIT